MTPTLTLHLGPSSSSAPAAAASSSSGANAAAPLPLDRNGAGRTSDKLPRPHDQTADNEREEGDAPPKRARLADPPAGLAAGVANSSSLSSSSAAAAAPVAVAGGGGTVAAPGPRLADVVAGFREFFILFNVLAAVYTPLLDRFGGNWAAIQTAGWDCLKLVMVKGQEERARAQGDVQNVSAQIRAVCMENNVGDMADATIAAASDHSLRMRAEEMAREVEPNALKWTTPNKFEREVREATEKAEKEVRKLALAGGPNSPAAFQKEQEAEIAALRERAEKLGLIQRLQATIEAVGPHLETLQAHRQRVADLGVDPGKDLFNLWNQYVIACERKRAARAALA